MKQAVFLDRDGVLNRAVIRDGKPYPPSNASELELLPGVGDALTRLKQAHYLLIVVTNQPDVGRNVTTRAEVDTINRTLSSLLPVDEIRTCFHGSDDECNCRKPKPGMLLDAAQKWDIDLKRSYMVGDRWRDVAAGHAAGCKTFFVDAGYAERQPENVDFRVASLSEAASIILES